MRRRLGVCFGYGVACGLISFGIGVTFGTTAQILFFLPTILGAFFVGRWLADTEIERRYHYAHEVGLPASPTGLSQETFLLSLLALSRNTCKVVTQSPVR